jgi:hypothetical protein
MSEEEGKSKIYVDSDWKQEAAEEKKRLDEQMKEAPQSQQLPPANIYEIINLLVMQATVGLGGMKTPSGGVVPPDYGVAKYFIDLLEVLQEKTKGNLEEEESKALNAVLYELRMRYVQTVSGSGGQAPPSEPGK